VHALINSGVQNAPTKILDQVFEAERRAYGRFSGPQAMFALEKAYFELSLLSADALEPLFHGDLRISRNNVSLGKAFTQAGLTAASFPQYAADLYYNHAVRLIDDNRFEVYPEIFSHFAELEYRKRNYLLAAQLRETAIRYMEVPMPSDWLSVARYSLSNHDLASVDKAIGIARATTFSTTAEVDLEVKTLEEGRRALSELTVLKPATDVAGAIEKARRLRTIGQRREAIEHLIKVGEEYTDGARAFSMAAEFATLDGEHGYAEKLRLAAIGKKGESQDFYEKLYREWAFRLSTSYIDQSEEGKLRWKGHIAKWSELREDLGSLSSSRSRFRDIVAVLAGACYASAKTSEAWSMAVALFEEHPRSEYAASAILGASIFADDPLTGISLVHRAAALPMAVMPRFSAAELARIHIVLALAADHVDFLGSQDVSGDSGQDLALRGDLNSILSLVKSGEYSSWAMEAYEKSLEDRMRSADTTRNNLAVLLLRNGHTSKARKVLDATGGAGNKRPYVALTSAAIQAREGHADWHLEMERLANDAEAPQAVRVEAANWLHARNKKSKPQKHASIWEERGVTLDKKCISTWRVPGRDPFSFRLDADFWLLPKVNFDVSQPK
jgi:hypothetical protein